MQVNIKMKKTDLENIKNLSCQVDVHPDFYIGGIWGLVKI